MYACLTHTVMVGFYFILFCIITALSFEIHTLEILLETVGLA